MSMVISSNSVSAGQASLVQNRSQRRQDFSSLMSALQSGDLNAAKTAFDALNKDMSGTSATTAVGGNAGNPLAQIGMALQKGDLSGAQQAAQALQSGHHHHHHHDGDGAQGVASNLNSTTVSTPGNVPSVGLTSLINVTA